MSSSWVGRARRARLHVFFVFSRSSRIGKGVQPPSSRVKARFVKRLSPLFYLLFCFSSNSCRILVVLVCTISSSFAGLLELVRVFSPLPLAWKRGLLRGCLPFFTSCSVSACTFTLSSLYVCTVSIFMSALYLHALLRCRIFMSALYLQAFFTLSNLLIFYHGSLQADLLAVMIPNRSVSFLASLLNSIWLSWPPFRLETKHDCPSFLHPFLYICHTWFCKFLFNQIYHGCNISLSRLTCLFV